MGKKVAILGATGAVGQELLQILAERSFPISELVLLASPRSAGSTLKFRGQDVAVQAVSKEAFAGVAFAFFSAGADRSLEWAPVANEAGATVIDNSSAFRTHPDVPLVVPEINGDELGSRPKRISVPNCTAILLTMVLHPIRALGTFDRVVVSTYQSASGGGASMMQALVDQTKAALAGEPPKASAAFPPYAFNLFSHNTAIGPDGFNGEESKVMTETRRILGLQHLSLMVTCVRVPVLRAHSETVVIDFAGEAPCVECIREALASAPGVRLLDDRENNDFPTPLAASGGDDVLVGRIRRDPSRPNSIALFLAGDQLRKGAALNAVQIAERLI